MTGGAARDATGHAAAGARRASTRFASLSGALAEYLDKSGLGDSLARLGAVDEWASAVGPRVAEVTRAVEVRGDVLVVEVLSSAWINELSMMRGLVLERVNASRAEAPVRAVRFRLAETAEGLGGGRRRRRSSRSGAGSGKTPNEASGRTNGGN